MFVTSECLQREELKSFTARIVNTTSKKLSFAEIYLGHFSACTSTLCFFLTLNITYKNIVTYLWNLFFYSFKSYQEITKIT